MIAGPGTTWPRRSGLTAADTAPGDGFGCSAATAAATAVVSARYRATEMDTGICGACLSLILSGILVFS